MIVDLVIAVVAFIALVRAEKANRVLHRIAKREHIAARLEWPC